MQPITLSTEGNRKVIHKLFTAERSIFFCIIGRFLALDRVFGNHGLEVFWKTRFWAIGARGGIEVDTGS